jgi:hypothetical protein
MACVSMGGDGIRKDLCPLNGEGRRKSETARHKCVGRQAEAEPVMNKWREDSSIHRVGGRDYVRRHAFWGVANPRQSSFSQTNAKGARMCDMPEGSETCKASQGNASKRNAPMLGMQASKFDRRVLPAEETTPISPFSPARGRGGMWGRGAANDEAFQTVI